MTRVIIGFVKNGENYTEFSIRTEPSVELGCKYQFEVLRASK